MEKDSAPEADKSKKLNQTDTTNAKQQEHQSTVQNPAELTNKTEKITKLEPQPTSTGKAEVTDSPRRVSITKQLKPQPKSGIQETISSEAKGKEGSRSSVTPLAETKSKSKPKFVSPSTNREKSDTEPKKEMSASSVPQEKRRESVSNQMVSRIQEIYSRSRSSSKTSDTVVAEDVLEPRPPEKPASSSKPIDQDRRRSSLKTLEDASSVDASKLRDTSRKSSYSPPYNPFGSFQRRVSIADPERDIKSGRLSTLWEAPRVSIPAKKPRESTVFPEKTRRSSSLRPGRPRSISVFELTKQDVAICFFPEEPDWGDDDDDEDEQEDDFVTLPKRMRSDSIFPDPKTPYDWSQRERWQSRLVYLIALVTYSISFSNIYHFPALVYHYGGIPFLIPYTIFTLILGYPLHFLESSLGQYSQSGPVRVWDAAPIARGVGWSMFFLCLVVAYYYNMYAAYSVIYFSQCFNTILPWQDCDEPAISNYSCVPRMCVSPNTNHFTPAEHYFYHHVLKVRTSEEILGHGLGPMVWTQVIGYLFAWILVYVAIIQSVRSIGKVVFVLVVLPYFILLMLLTAGLMLEGSSRGIKLLFTSSFDHLLDIQIWRVAAEEVFFELGICQGTPLAFGSYCHHRNPTHIDSAIICAINYFTSILCAVVIFLILGALSMEIGAPVAGVSHHGPGMVFISYPEAFSRVPGSHIWCFMFFLMLFSVAVGTQIAIMETAMTVIYDEFNNARPYRWLINLLICSCLFVLGIVLCTSNGYFVVHLLDRMAGTMPRLPIAVCMVGTIVLIYGTSKYCEDIHFMIGYYPNAFIRICFIITPFMLLALTIPSWVLKEPLRALKRNYSPDAINVGWFTVWFILIWTVLGAIYWCIYCYSSGQLRGIFRSLNSWGPRNFDARVARTEFSSEDVSNFTKPWAKKSVKIEAGDVE